MAAATIRRLLRFLSPYAADFDIAAIAAIDFHY